MHTLRTDHRAAHGHEQGCGDAFTTDVGYHEGDVVVVDTEEVVEVASHILGRLHGGVDVELVADVGERGKLIREDILLDLAGDGQFFLQRLQLRMLFLRLMDVMDLTDGLLDGHIQVVHIDRLGDKVEGAAVHGLADVQHITVGTHHDDPQGWIMLLIHIRQQLQTVHHGHVDVAEDNLDVGVVVQDVQRLHAVTGIEELILAGPDLAPEVLSHQRFDGLLVIDAQNLDCSHVFYFLPFYLFHHGKHVFPIGAGVLHLIHLLQDQIDAESPDAALLPGLRDVGRLFLQQVEGHTTVAET